MKQLLHLSHSLPAQIKPYRLHWKHFLFHIFHTSKISRLYCRFAR